MKFPPNEDVSSFVMCATCKGSFNGNMAQPSQSNDFLYLDCASTSAEQDQRSEHLFALKETTPALKHFHSLYICLISICLSK